jgi:hypothetical protein
MKPKENSVFLRELKDQTANHILQAKERFAVLNKDQLTKKANNDGWSIVECLEHLNTYSDYYLPEISKKLGMGNTKSVQSFKSGWLGNFFVNMMNPEKGNKKYNAAPKHIPVINKDADTIVNDFIKNQERLLDLLTNSQNINLNKVRIPISINRLIKLKLGDIFSFLVMHNERHVQQALRNLS